MPAQPPEPASRPPRGRHRPGVRLALGVLLIVGVMYGLVPQLPGLNSTLRRLGGGDVTWLAFALLFELLSFGAYVVVFHAVFSEPGSRVGWRSSYQLTMAGVVATRLLATGGAGGIALTAWALLHAGLDGEEVRRRLAAFLVLLYSVFMASLLVAGLGLRTGVLAGPAPFGLTVVPAAFAATVVAVALTLALVPVDLASDRDGALGFAAAIPATVSAGVRGALALLRAPRAGLLGAVGWWGFDIATLWACLHAFDATPPVGVIVVAYFVGMVGNLLPVPGGIGGVEGGMVGALLGLGVASGPAILGVLAYRAFAFWLPILPGALAYIGLLRKVRLWDAAPAVTRSG